MAKVVGECENLKMREFGNYLKIFEMENYKTELINKFLEKKLSENEIIEFKKLYNEDEKFSYEVKNHLNMIASIKAAEKISIEKSQKIRKINWNYIVGIAAILLIFITIGFIFFRNKNLTSSEIYSEYYKPLESKENTMGEDFTEIKIKEAFDYYNYEKYEIAVEVFEQIDDSLENYTIYTGICYLEIENFENAINKFKIVTESNSLMKNDAKWYLGLTYLKINKIEEAKRVFYEISNSSSQYSEKANEILEKL